MTIYISGPMTGIPDENRPAFNEVAQALRAAGHDVFNPAENGLPATATWAQHMRADIAALMDCDSILLLAGWQYSKGATLELVIALDLGMTVHHEVENLTGELKMESETLEDRFTQQIAPQVRFVDDVGARRAAARKPGVRVIGPDLDIDLPALCVDCLYHREVKVGTGGETRHYCDHPAALDLIDGNPQLCTVVRGDSRLCGRHARLFVSEQEALAGPKAVAIYGPQGIGKSLFAEQLAAFYRKARVIDHIKGAALSDYAADMLVLTNTPLRGAFHFIDAMAAADLPITDEMKRIAGRRNVAPDPMRAIPAWFHSFELDPIGDLG